MKVVMLEPNKKAYIKDIDSSLESMQEIVGGYIQCVYPFEDNVGIVCNEEGKLLGLPLNRPLTHEGQVYDVIAGTAFIVGLGEEDFDSLSDELAEKYMEIMKNPVTLAY